MRLVMFALVILSAPSVAMAERYRVVILLDNNTRLTRSYGDESTAIAAAVAIIEDGYIERKIECGRRQLNCTEMLRLIPIHRVQYINIRPIAFERSSTRRRREGDAKAVGFIKGSISKGLVDLYLTRGQPLR